MMRNGVEHKIKRKVRQWFYRCLGMFLDKTLLNHLLSYGYEPADYLAALDKYETAVKAKKAFEKYLEEHPEEKEDSKESLAFYDDDILEWREELGHMEEDWLPGHKPNMEEELERVREWVEKKNAFRCV